MDFKLVSSRLELGVCVTAPANQTPQRQAGGGWLSIMALQDPRMLKDLLQLLFYWDFVKAFLSLNPTLSSSLT